MTLDQLKKLLLKKMAKFSGKGRAGPAGIGLSGWCKHHNVNKGHVSQFLNGHRGPDTDLLEALGLEWTVSRKRKGE